MQWQDIIIIAFVAAAAIFAALYFLNKWAAKKSVQSQSAIEKNKMAATIYVIDKRRDKAANVNLPKAISDNLPKLYRVMRLYFVKAKIGPQIMTLICEKKVYNLLAPMKTYKVDMAGIYIVSVKGMKTAYEMRQAAKEKAAKAKQARSEAKAKEKEAKRK